jgi:peptide/nickel transport system substrate-binding protein
MKWRTRVALTALLVGALGSTPVAAQKSGGTLTIVRPTDPVSLDPQLETTAPGAWVYFNMLEPLLTMDDKMQIRPALATGYEVLSPTKVRFKLRPGVKFHDGTPFNAAAVKFTFDRALRGTPPARWASLAGSLSGAEVVDDLTVDVTTREPYGPILRTIAMYCTGIVSPTAVQKMGEGFSRAPVGTGPFKFVEWKTNTHVILERNPDYWGDKAPLDRVIFKVIPEEGARMIALQTGDADMGIFTVVRRGRASELDAARTRI